MDVWEVICIWEKPGPASGVVYDRRDLNLRVYEPYEALRGKPFSLREEGKEERERCKVRIVDVGFVGKLRVTSGVTTCLPILGRWGKCVLASGSMHVQFVNAVEFPSTIAEA
jgi:hypothetical protein